MEPRLLVAGVLAVVALAVAWVVERRKPDAPAGTAPGHVPRQLDRNDFARPDAPWLVVLFSSRTCDGCASAATKVLPLECENVAVQDAEWSQARDLHERYGIDAVPLVLVADPEGVVHKAFLGHFSATDLWAAVAEAREAGSTPEPDLGVL